ncbi:MAG: dienelactone hydrolase family protein [Planctomycetes bacterium]|nr:dienelactone hydrolase family protein [Planctomycetota bacterium]
MHTSRIGSAPWLRLALLGCLPLGCLSLGACDTVSPSVDVVGEEVHYTAADGTHCVGYLAWDRSRAGRRPGVLVVHEWWGHDEYVRQRARQLAALGYAALAVDMYGEGKHTEHPAEAQEFMQAVLARLESGAQRFEAGRALLAAQPTVDPTRIAAIGYCFGGGVVLQMARSGAELAGVASFHGSLGAAERTTPGRVHTQVLVCHGAADSLIPAEQVAAVKAEFGARLEFHEYPGAKHGFTNPAADRLGAAAGIPIGYDAAADAQSWAALQAFLVRVFG